MKTRRIFWLTVALTLLAVFIDLPRPIKIREQEIFLPAINWRWGRFRFVRDLKIKQGIDLAGGTHLVFQADVGQVKEEDRQAALEATKENIERRINLFGISEANVQTSRKGEDYRLIVELPGIKEIDQAISLIGQTAQLQFWELKEGVKEATTTAEFQPTELSGKDLIRSRVQFDPNTGEPVVALEFSHQGAEKFAEITKRNLNKPLAIYLDNVPLTAPLVKEPITTGQAVISGGFNLEEAKRLSIALNAGALPLPLKIIEQRNIGASLGVDSVKKSIRAGLIGLLMVAFFMIGCYRSLGVLADVGLFVFGLLTLALYKLIPVTLTLPGVAGFLLSVGMAVDANILIFERMKEELRAGQPPRVALELGFGRAWDSIRDANVCTLITCFILFNPFNWSFLNTSGMVRGFALTLGLGVLISLFTGIVVTRTILRTFSLHEYKRT